MSHHVVCSSDLEAKDRLQVFSLEPDLYVSAVHGSPFCYSPRSRTLLIDSRRMLEEFQVVTEVLSRPLLSRQYHPLHRWPDPHIKIIFR